MRGRRRAASAGAAGVDLLNDAIASFDDAARWGLGICLAAVLLAAVAAARGLSPARQRPSDRRVPESAA